MPLDGVSKKIVEKPYVRAAMLPRGFPVLQKPVFIMTGITVARGISVKRENKSLKARKSQMLIVVQSYKYIFGYIHN